MVAIVFDLQCLQGKNHKLNLFTHQKLGCDQLKWWLSTKTRWFSPPQITICSIYPTKSCQWNEFLRKSWSNSNGAKWLKWLALRHSHRFTFSPIRFWIPWRMNIFRKLIPARTAPERQERSCILYNKRLNKNKNNSYKSIGYQYNDK